MFGIGPIELALVLVVALLVFGPKKLPELARTVGRGLAEFRRASTDLRRSMEFDLDSHETPSPPAPAQASSPHLPPETASALEQAEATEDATATTPSPEDQAPVTADTSDSEHGPKREGQGD